MEYFALTDTGKWREQNEDFFYADQESGLFIVADGMGGHNAGEVASRLAVESFVNRFTALKENINSAQGQKAIQGKDKNAAILAESFLCQSYGLRDVRIKKKPQRHGYHFYMLLYRKPHCKYYSYWRQPYIFCSRWSL